MKSGNKFSTIFVLFLLLVKVFPAGAQTSIAFYSLEDQFNSSGFNPAFLDSKHKLTVSIFPFGGTSIGYNNQQAIKQIVTKFISGITTDSDYKKLLNSLANHPSFHQSIESSLLNVTYRTASGTLNFRINENENFSARISGNVSNFIIKEGIQSTPVGKQQNLPAQAMHYREYSIAFATPVLNQRFSAGFRAKLLYGKSAFVSNLSGVIQDQPAMYLLRTEGKVNISAPEENALDNSGKINSFSIFTGSKTIDYLMNNGNPGMAIDLGLKYKITPSLTATASVIDLGKINWKTNLNSKFFNGVYEIKPGDVKSSFSPDGTEIITKLTGTGAISDSISNLFNLQYDRNYFSTGLPASVYTGLSYAVNPTLRINFMNRYVVLKDLNYNSSSLTANFKLHKNLTVNTGYAIIGDSFNNIPLAILFQGDFGQIYMGTDNLAAFLIPDLSDFAGFSFGTCFYLFKNRTIHKSPSEHFPFYKVRKSSKGANGRILDENWDI